MGRITTVRYGITKNIGNYESLRLDAEMEVSEGQDPAETLVALRLWINEQLGTKDQLERLYAEKVRTQREIQSLEWDKRRVLEDLYAMKKKWREAQSILAAAGITTVGEFLTFEDETEAPSTTDESEQF